MTTQTTQSRRESAANPAGAMTAPQAIRCPHCNGLAGEEARERSDDDLVVRYTCSECRHQATRHFPASGADAT